MMISDLLYMNIDVLAWEARKSSYSSFELSFPNHDLGACLRPYSDLSSLHEWTSGHYFVCLSLRDEVYMKKLHISDVISFWQSILSFTNCKSSIPRSCLVFCKLTLTISSHMIDRQIFVDQQLHLIVLCNSHVASFLFWHHN
jgi:hypothetical protein